MSGPSEFCRPDVITSSEIECFVDALEISTFKELGTNKWIDKHDRIEKLTLQAIVQALSDREETVKECIISREKLRYLIHDLILNELWREEIFPKLLESGPKSTFGIYTILFHEATCINLIETILFHPESAATLGDSALDLIDYSIRSLNWLLINKDENSAEKLNSLDLSLLDHSQNVLFRISFKALACLRYVIENIDKIETSVIPRLLLSGDVPMLLTDLLLQKPWTCRNNEGIELIYNSDEQNWNEIDACSRQLIGKIEGQAWLAIYQLFKNSSVVSTYEIHSYRKNQLIKLRSLLHEVALDQIPVLVEFQRWLNELALSSGPVGPNKSPLILEMLPPFRTMLENELKENKEEIIGAQLKELVYASHEELTQKAQRLTSTYDFEAFEAVLPKSAKCGACGEPATKRCGRCRNEWYCKRGCQVKHWGKHKIACNLSVPDDEKKA